MKKRGLGRKNLFFMSIIGGMLANFVISRITNILDSLANRGIMGILNSVTFFDVIMIVFGFFLVWYTIKKVE